MKKIQLTPTVPIPNPLGKTAPLRPNPQPVATAIPPAPVLVPIQPAQGRGLLLLGLALLATVALLLTAVIVLFLLYRSSLILPGVRVGSLELGGLSRAEAVALLQQSWQGPGINLVDETGRLIPVSPETLGISLNAEATVELAYQQGRSRTSLVQAIKSGGQVDVLPVWQIDLPRARANLQMIAPQVETAPINAGLVVVTGRVEATPAQPGRSLDLAATLAWLERHAEEVIREGQLSLVTRPVPPAVTDASAAVNRANELLASPPTLSAYDPITAESFTWAMSQAEWSEALSFSLDPARPGQLDWSVKEAQVRLFVDSRSAELGDGRYVEVDQAVAALMQTEPVRLRVYHREREHTVRPGETFSSIGYDYGLPYPWIQQANPNAAEALSPGQVITIPSPDALLPLPVVEHKRIVVSLSQQKMWAYENGQVKWEWPVSTGIPASPTSPGIFQVQTHELEAYAASWNLWMPHFMGIYRPVPASDFMNGFHGFPTRNGSTLLWTDDLGHRVTYGCILVSSDNAALLYDWAEAGVVVEIQK